MYVPKALIADPSEEVRDALTCALAAGFQVVSCPSGHETLALLDSWEPDILILELQLPGLDGIGVLRRLKARPCRPRILVLTDMNSPFVCGTLQELEVDYAMRKPTPAAIVAERAEELLVSAAQNNLTRAAADILMSLSIPNASQGYRNLLTALPSLALCRDQSLGKELYPQIVETNRVSPASVEKAIRDAIHAGWTRGDRAQWLRYFPGFTRCPRNREFLFRIAECLCRRQRCG